MGQHVIRSQILEIVVAQMDARPPDSVLQDLWERCWLPEMEQVLDALELENRVVRIDRLDLNLGRLRPEQLETEGTERLRIALQESLARETGISIADMESNLVRLRSGFVSENKATAVRTALEVPTARQINTEELLQYYLQTGQLPWWGPQAPDWSVGEAVREMLTVMETRGAAGLSGRIPDSWRRLLRQENVRKRIAGQVPAELQWRWLERWLGNGVMQRLREWSDHWPKMLREAGLVESGEVLSFQYYIWRSLSQPAQYNYSSASGSVYLAQLITTTLNDRPVTIEAAFQSISRTSTYRQQISSGMQQELEHIFEIIPREKTGPEYHHSATKVDPIIETSPENPPKSRIHPKNSPNPNSEAIEGHNVNGERPESVNPPSADNTPVSPSPKTDPETVNPDEESVTSLTEERKTDPAFEVASREAPLEANPRTRERETPAERDSPSQNNPSNIQSEALPPSDTESPENAAPEKKHINSNTHSQELPTARSESKLPTAQSEFEINADIKERFQHWRKQFDEHPEQIWEQSLSQHDPIPWFSEDEREGIYLPYAGCVLLWPFLKPFYTQLGLFADRTFSDEAAQGRAIALLYYLASGRRDDFPEQETGMMKTLLGWELRDPLPEMEPLREAECAEGDRLLESVIGHWSALKKTKPQTLRERFLARPGKLIKDNAAYQLQIERGPFDVLLDRLPWGIGTIRLPWLKQLMYVEW